MMMMMMMMMMMELIFVIKCCGGYTDVFSSESESLLRKFCPLFDSR